MTRKPEVMPPDWQIGPEKRASVYEYRVHSRLSASRKLLLAGTGTNCRPFVEVRLVAAVMKSIALVQSGLISVLLEPKGATQEARFSSYCRLLPPRQIAKLLEENKITGAGDGNRTHVRSLGNCRRARLFHTATWNATLESATRNQPGSGPAAAHKPAAHRVTVLK
jgi:hypothetical protein